MILATSLELAVGAILRNKLRSALTALGIVIGVASVIALVHVGEGATRQVTSHIAGLGQSLVIVLPGTHRAGHMAPQGRPFELADALALAAEVPDVLVAPLATMRSVAVVGSANYPTTVTGTTSAYFAVRDWPLARGRTFTETELASGAAVCVVGRTVVEELFPDAEPLGSSVRIRGAAFEVVGVLTGKGAGMGQDQDDVIIVPLKTLQRRLTGNDDVGMIFLSALGERGSAQAKEDVTSLLRQRRRLRTQAEDDFQVHDMQELLETMQSATKALTGLLGAIAAVSLVVGGIGIMNIMLVSVTERTREIGIRLAIGARAREVLLQFLVEAIVLSGLGGALGVVLGVAGSYAAATQLDLPFVFSPRIVVIAFGFSAAIGVIFGYLPARKAAHLDPIEALRRE